MKKLLKFTKEDLVEAFFKWDQEVVKYPERCKEITGTVEFASEQAEVLIDYLSLQTCYPQGNCFGSAIDALKDGKRVTRVGWNGTGMFVFMRPADNLHIDMVIDKVKSLPQSVKDYYLQDILDEKGNRISPADENDKVKFTAYLCLKAADGTVVNGWLASQTDMLAEDWIILD